MSTPQFQRFTGNSCPVPPSTLVAVDLGDADAVFVSTADRINWAGVQDFDDTAGALDAGAGRVKRYAVLALPVEAAAAEVGFIL